MRLGSEAADQFGRDFVEDDWHLVAASIPSNGKGEADRGSDPDDEVVHGIGAVMRQSGAAGPFTVENGPAKGVVVRRLPPDPGPLPVEGRGRRPRLVKSFQGCRRKDPSRAQAHAGV